jgi:hypothetical protein
VASNVGVSVATVQCSATVGADTHDGGAHETSVISPAVSCPRGLPVVDASTVGMDGWESSLSFFFLLRYLTLLLRIVYFSVVEKLNL